MSERTGRRMSRHIRLVLVGGLPGLLGCAGCCGCGGDAKPAAGPEPLETVEEIDPIPPPEGSEHLLGAPFVGWWHVANPPRVTHRAVPRSVVTSGGYTRSSSGIYHRTYYGGVGRSGFLSGGASRPSSGGMHGGGVSHGGFGSTGHAASGGS